MIKPSEAVYFHVEHKPRHNNPTFNSNNVFDSLNALGSNQYASNLLKDTEYKDHFASNRRSSIVPSYNYSRRAGPQNQVNLEKQNGCDMQASYFSAQGAKLLSK